MIERMRKILKTGAMCVLATSSNDRPHCSLMAFITDDSVKTVYMVTLSASRKYANMRSNPHVSLLVDTRLEQHAADSIQALTVTGTVRPLTEGEQKEAILEQIVRARPHLRELASREDAEVIAVQIDSLQLLVGPISSYFHATE